jgi:sulfoquinovose isomerase
MDLLDTIANNYDPKKKGFVRPATALVETWLNARYTYCFSIQSSKPDQQSSNFAELGVQALNETLYDDDYGGWFENNQKVSRKNAYSHAFVLLASVFAIKAEIKNSEVTFQRIISVINQYFWDQQNKSSFESFAQDWSEREPYRGANSNMHMTEAFLATYYLTKDPMWLDRALAITKKITAASQTYGFRIPEHFDSNWQVNDSYNLENPKDAFRPYGVIPGHGFEWARLCLHLFHATSNQQKWLEQAAVNLYSRAKKDSFKEDGFVYTTDLNGSPIVTLRMHWVVCEAISAAAVFSEHFSQKDLADDLKKYWQIANQHFVKPGLWLHELDSNNNPSSEIWADNPDIYHAYNAIALTNDPESLFPF